MEALTSFAIDPLVLHELATEANMLKQQALDALRNGMVAAEKAEREAAELADRYRHPRPDGGHCGGPEQPGRPKRGDRHAGGKADQSGAHS
jgi:hypothetical protein